MKTYFGMLSWKLRYLLQENVQQAIANLELQFEK